MKNINNWKNNLEILANKFDMSADEALETLKKRGFSQKEFDFFFLDGELDSESERQITAALGPDDFIIKSFLDGIITDRGTKNGTLCIHYSNESKIWFPQEQPNTPIPNHNITYLKGVDWENSLEDGSSFDMVLGDFPLNMRSPSGNSEDLILQSLSYLNDSGIAFYMVSHSFLAGVRGSRFKEELMAQGFYINAILESPDNIIKFSSMLPSFIAISKVKTTEIFAGKLLNSTQAYALAKCYLNPLECDNKQKDLYNGVRLPIDKFFSIDRLFANIQIEKLESSYKEYKQCILKDLAVEINRVQTGGEFTEKDNAIYIPNIGKSEIVCNLSTAKLKHQNYFQIVLNNTVLNQYLSLFYMSELGRLVIDSLLTGSMIKHINKGDIGNAIVALPDLSTQLRIVNTHNKITKLQNTIQEFSKEMALNPKSLTEMLEKLDDMLDVVGNITESDKIRNLSQKPESVNLEFKETLSWNIKQKQKDKDGVETSALKTIVGFLNSVGGTLLIGVADDGEIKGINTEVKKLHKNNLDKFKLYFADILQTRIGEEFYEYYKNYEVYDVDGKMVLKIDCTPYEKKPGTYLDGDYYYKRENPRTILLENKALVEYIDNHYK